MLWRYPGETNSRNGWKDDPLVNTDDEIIIQTRNLSVHYDTKPAVLDINLDIVQHKVTALIGPSGCGKSTLLRCFNRMNDLYSNVRIEGAIALHGENIYDKGVNVADLRRRVGMVFQKPNPFPKSIYD